MEGQAPTPAAKGLKEGYETGSRSRGELHIVDRNTADIDCKVSSWSQSALWVSVLAISERQDLLHEAGILVR